MTKTYLLDDDTGDPLLHDDTGDPLFYVTESPIPDPATPSPDIEYHVDLCHGFVKLGEATSATFEGVLRNTRIGEWVLTAPLNGLEIEADRIGDVDSVIVWDDHPNEPRVIYAGIVRDVGDVHGSITRQVTAEGTTMEFRGVDVFGLLAQRTVWPNPAENPPWSTSHDERTGVGSTVAAGFITDNIGSGALAERQVPGVVVVDPEIGVESTWSGRLIRLDLLVGQICRDCGISLRATCPEPGVFRFEFDAPKDYSNRLLFTDQGDLDELSRLVSPASATFVIGAGQGQLTARLFTTASTGAVGLDRVETVYDNTNVTTSDGLITATAGRLAQSLEGASVDGSIAVSAAQRIRYLDDYDLGDVLGVEVDSVRYAAPVEAVSFSLAPERQAVLPVLGRATSNLALQLVRSVDGLSTRFDTQLA